MNSLSTGWRIALSILSGLLFFLAFPPVQWHWLGWVALWPLLVAVLGASGRVALLCGMVTTFSFYGLSVYWVFTIFATHGRLPWLAAGGVQLLLLLYLSTYRVAFCVLLAWLSRRHRSLALAVAPFLWVAMEFAFVRTPHFSLPWNLLGYAATEQSGVLQLASLTGVYGLSFAMAAFSALLGQTWRNPVSMNQRFANGLLIAIIAAVALAQIVGAFLLPVAEAPLSARLVQTNFDQGEWCANCPSQQQLPADLEEIERLSSASVGGGAFLLWPEVPRPFYLQDATFAARAQRIAVTNGGRFLLGVIEWRASGEVENAGASQPLRPRNSAVLLGASGERLYTYDKIHLVPFGEYVPLREWFRFADSLVAEVGGFVAGREPALGQLPEGKFATLICFEAVFPGEVRQFVAGGAELLVNISNDGWLGPTGGPAQHMNMARMRAVENRRWLLRSTNSGVTVVVDPYGRITAQLPAGQRAALDARFGMRSGQTLYTRFGDWFAWLCVAASALGILLAVRPEPPAGKSERKGRKG